jgi:hypothetical protein
MHGILLLAALMTYHYMQAAADDNVSLPFKLGTHTFDQHIQQEYQLHVCHRLKKLRQHYPNHAIVNLYEHLTTTSLNQLVSQQELFEKAQSVYTSIQTCPNVTHQFNLAANQSKYKNTPETWELFRITACTHLRKFNEAELPPLNLAAGHEPTPAQINAYKTWLIVYFAIKQNEYMGKN